jgi:hypothetical protein
VSAQPTSQVLPQSLPHYVVTSLLRFSVSSVLSVVKFFLSKAATLQQTARHLKIPPLFSVTSEMLFPQPLSFHIHAENTRGGPRKRKPGETAVKTLSFSAQPAFGRGEVGAAVA